MVSRRGRALLKADGGSLAEYGAGGCADSERKGEEWDPGPVHGNDAPMEVSPGSTADTGASTVLLEPLEGTPPGRKVRCDWHLEFQL